MDDGYDHDVNDEIIRPNFSMTTCLFFSVSVCRQLPDGTWLVVISTCRTVMHSIESEPVLMVSRLLILDNTWVVYVQKFGVF